MTDESWAELEEQRATRCVETTCLNCGWRVRYEFLDPMSDDGITRFNIAYSPAFRTRYGVFISFTLALAGVASFATVASRTSSLPTLMLAAAGAAFLVIAFGMACARPPMTWDQLNEKIDGDLRAAGFSVEWLDATRRIVMRRREGSYA